MNKVLSFIFCSAFALSACAAEPTTQATDYKPRLDKDGWEVLFDGKDLDAFDVPKNGSWVITDQGELFIAKPGRHLYAKKRYCDFVVECDFKVGGHAHANSGVLFRIHSQSDPINTGFEIQILDNDDHHVKFDALNACGALYDMVPPRVAAVKPVGEWNHYRITVNDNIVQAEMNGQAIVDADLNQWTTAQKNPDGKRNKYKYAMGDLPREGFFALQNHGGTPVWFRNVRIKPLGDRQPKYTGKEPIKDVLRKPETAPSK